MPDNEVIALALKAGNTAGAVLHGDPFEVDLDEVARVLREAGFARWPANFKTRPHELFEAVRSGMIHRDILVDLGVTKDMSWQGETA